MMSKSFWSLIILCLFLTGCDIDHDQTNTISQSRDITKTNSELSSSENSTVYEYEDSEAILRRVTDRWETPIRLAKKKRTITLYSTLLKRKI